MRAKYALEVVLIIFLISAWEAEFFILDILPCLAQTTETYLVTEGLDASNGSAAFLTTKDLNALGASDDTRMASDNAWTGSDNKGLPDFDENYHFEFTFSPAVPSKASIDNVQFTFEYRRNGALDGAKFKVWKNSDQTWHDEQIGIPENQSTDQIYTIGNLNSYIHSPDDVNNIKLRFLAYRTQAGKSQTTSHDYVALSATYTATTDTIPPSEATNLQSSSHTVSTWSSDNTIDLTWIDAVDDNEGGSGLDGYSGLWDTSSDTLPDEIKNFEEDVETITSPELADGKNHYFHIRAVDNAGNWDNAAVHLGPFYIDTQGPEAPTLISPSNNTVTSDASPTFSWSASSDGEGSSTKSYRIYIDDESTFSPPRVKEYTTSNPSYTPNLYGGYFYWKVYAKDNVDNIGNWSNIWELRIEPGSSNSGSPTYPRHLWINEFLPNPEGKDTENEFIEIYNNGPDEIDLNNWQIDDCEDKGSKPHAFPENKKIAAGEYLALPYSETKITLNNDEDCVRLLWPDGTAIDEVEYLDPLENESYNKTNSGWRWSCTATPGEPNKIASRDECATSPAEEAKNYSRLIWINEFLPDPLGKDEEGEFIELQNRGDEEIDLSAWQIDDCAGTGSHPYTLPENTKIKIGGYLVLSYQDTKISLNNTGDCVRLLWPDGTAIDEIEYGKAPEGQSYSRQNINHWQWTQLSPGQDNEFPQVLSSAIQKTAPKSPLLPATGPKWQIYILLSLVLATLNVLLKFSKKI